MSTKKPTLIVFAGPNGSGKSTIKSYLIFNFPYINADEIKLSLGCDDKTATIEAYNQRIRLLESNSDFAFETVLSSHYNLDLLKMARDKGYFIKCFYVLTADPNVNVSRVRSRVNMGGHNVPEDKIISRYFKCLSSIPEVIRLCDVIHIYDNTSSPFRIFKKKKEEMSIWPNRFWSEEDIRKLTNQ